MSAFLFGYVAVIAFLAAGCLMQATKNTPLGFCLFFVLFLLVVLTDYICESIKATRK